jgi:hypothetical protein
MNMTKDDAEEYTQALGQVVAGSWRQVALGHRLGVPVALGLTTDQWVEDRLGGYVKLNIPARREAVAELTDEGMTRTDIAGVLGVGTSTVGADRARRNRTGDSQKLPVRKATANGRVRNRTPAEPDEAATIEAQNNERIDAWVDSIETALGVLTRMAGYPVPGELTDRLSASNSAMLVTVLDAITATRKVEA